MLVLSPSWAHVEARGWYGSPLSFLHLILRDWVSSLNPEAPVLASLPAWPLSPLDPPSLTPALRSQAHDDTSAFFVFDVSAGALS